MNFKLPVQFSFIPAKLNFLFSIIIFTTTGVSMDNPLSFEGHTDIGKINLPGSFSFDADKQVYRITGSGENIWYNEDAFHFVWKKSSGDISLSTDITWEGEGKHDHRKAGWMIRTSLEKDAPYVDAASHGDGLISLQFRKLKGGETFQVEAPVKAPATIHLEKTGNQFSLFLTKDDKFYPVGTVSLEMTDEIFAGIFVCSHDSTTSETALFSNVKYSQTKSIPEDERIVESTLEIFNIEAGAKRIVRKAKEHFEAPNWSRDGSTLYYNSGGKIYTIPVEGGTPKIFNTGFADRCNNDHGLSPDGKQLVVSHHGEDHKSRIYVLNGEAAEPRLITTIGPSYWHGWSPDGNTLVYTAGRNDNYDIYTIPVTGGEEKRLTDVPELDDGPDYSPDGKYIYFNSIRTGQMKIWRMSADGTNQIQVTPDDEYGDWFAHPSPDGKWIVFLSYDKSIGEGHPPNKDVLLRLMPAKGSEIKTIVTLFGGQGTINVPSWSPDSKEFAFVSYRLVAP